MKLLQLKHHFESMPVDAEFNYSISFPFSWRGSYDEVAFAIKNEPATVVQILERINSAYTRPFSGWKGGLFTYNDDTDVHFEEDYSCYTDGGYSDNLLINVLFK